MAAKKKKSGPVKRGKVVQKHFGNCAKCADEQEVQRVQILSLGMRWRCKKCDTCLDKSQKVKTVS